MTPTPTEAEVAAIVAGPFIELRPDHQGRFDELVARFADGLVHVETMTDGSVFIGFWNDDGRGHQLWISSKKKLTYNEADASGPPPRFSAAGIDRRPDLPQHLIAAGGGE